MKPQAVYFCNEPSRINYVYSAQQQRNILQLTDIDPDLIITDRNISEHDLSQVEIIFSTWGMLALSEDTIKQKLPKLKIVFYAAGATDDFVRPFLHCNVQVASSWQANARPVAEMGLALILLSLKGYFQNSRNIRFNRSWTEPKPFYGPGVYGEKVTLIGDGAVACELKELLENFKVQVIMIPSRPHQRTVSLEEAFSQSMVISNHLPDRTDNKKVITFELLNSMRHGATFINTGRGAQVDEAALYQVMAARKDLTALLDVMDPEPPKNDCKLYDLSNVVMSSHIAGSINDEVHRLAEFAIEECQRYLAGEELKYLVSEDILISSTK